MIAAEFCGDNTLPMQRQRGQSVKPQNPPPMSTARGYGCAIRDGSRSVIELRLTRC